MVGWSWDAREPQESRCDFIDEVFRGGYKIDELHNQVRGPVAFEGMQHAGNARYATPRVSHCMVGNVPLSCDLGPQIAGVAKFDEEFRPDSYGCSVGSLGLVRTLVFEASRNDLGLQGGYLFHGDVFWISRRKEVEGKGCKTAHTCSLGRATLSIL